MSHYILEIDTCINNLDSNNITIELIDQTTVDVINNTTVLISDLPEGYPLDWTVGDLPISRVSGLDIVAGSGISVVDNSGIFTISTTGDFGLTTEQVDDRVASLIKAGDYTSIVYDDLNNTLTIGISGVQPSGNYSVVGHSHSASDITDFNSSVSGLIPPSNFTSLTGISGIIVTNSGTDYYVSLLDPTIQLQNITDLSNNARTFLLTPSSSNLSSLVSDETGSGLLVFNNSPAFSGTPTVPTAPSGTNSTQIASTAFVRTEISNLIDSAPSTIDTLNELAAALGDDPNFATTIASGLGEKANLSGASFTGGISGPSGNFAVLQQSGINVSVSGHTHQYTDIINFASGIDDAVSTLLQAGSYISLNYDNINDTLTISATGVQPSGNYSVVGHTHTSSNITDFNSSVSGLLPVKDIIGSGYINISSSSGNYTVSATGLQPSGNYAQNIHFHTTSDVSISGTPLSVLDQFIIGRDAGGSLNDAILYDGGIDSFVINDFNTGVSGLLPSVSGSGYVNSNFSNNIYTISVSGLQPSGNYSVIGHTHTSSEITDFNSSVSGLLPVKDISAGTYINITNNSGIYTVNSTGEANLLETTVFNKTGSQIPKLSVVYINGGQGDQPTIALASASGEMTSSKTYGITAENINNMSTGKVIVAGALTGVNTDQFNPTAPQGDINGATLWLSPTVSGGLTSTKPSAPYHMVSVGTVVRTHQNEGVIEVRIQNGFELEELHNVAISGLANNQFIKYDSSTSLWKNVTAIASDISDFNSSVSGLISDRIQESFETVSKNLKNYAATLNYVSGTLDNIVYTLPSGIITKTFNYTGEALTSIVLSGNTPSGIDLTKTLTYTSGVLTNISYS